jgi:hypothetical protein
MLRAIAASALATAAFSADAADCKNHPALSPAVCCFKRAPESFNVTFATTVGGGSNFTLAITRSASPIGVDRFYGMAKCNYLSEEQEKDNRAGFFRVGESKSRALDVCVSVLLRT